MQFSADHSLRTLAELLSSGRLTSRELVAVCLSRIKQENPRLNLLAELYEEEALSMAEGSDSRRSKGHPLSPLDGIPFALKDNFLYAGHSCECASDMLAGFTSPYSATVVERLLSAGAIPLGRANMDEFAMGSRCSYSKFGAARNPKNPELSAGGSSGGSAGAVAAGFVPFALGSDTGGSVRLPAAWCGVSGFKPARGCVSRWGLVAFASSLDSVGLLTREPLDLLPLMECLQGEDGHDSTLQNGLWQQDELIRAILLWEGCEPDGARELISSLGLMIQNCPPPDLDAALATYRILSSAEATSNLARYDGLRYGHTSTLSEDAPPADLAEAIARNREEGFGEEVKRRLMTGIHALNTGLYPRAEESRRRLCRELAKMLPAGTVLLTKASSQTPLFVDDRGEDDHELDRYLVPASLAGLPSLMLPMGWCLTGSSASGKALLSLGQSLWEQFNDPNHSTTEEPT